MDKSQTAIMEKLVTYSIKYAEEENASPLKVFKMNIQDMYTFINAHFPPALSGYTSNSFIDLFCGYLKNRTIHLNVKIQEMAIRYLVINDFTVEFTIEERKERGEFLDKAYVEYEKEQKVIAELKGKTNDVLKLLRSQQLCSMPVSEIFSLLTRLEHETNDKMLIALDLYNYGYIQGKRAERAKRQHNAI